jgi:hypothetical protein
VEVLERQQHLGGVELGAPRRKLLALDVQHEVAAADVLHDKVHARLRLEARVQPEQERVALARGGEKHALLRLGAARESANALQTCHCTHLSTSSFSMMNSFFSTLMAYR